MIFRFETKNEILSTIIWTIAMSLVFVFLIYGFYPLFIESQQLMEDYIMSFPPEVIKAFGMDSNDLFRFDNYLNFIYLYMSLLGAIMASTVAISIFSRENRCKCEDFIFSKPIKKSKVFLNKLFSSLFLITLTNIPYIILYVLAYLKYSDDIITQNTLYLMLSLPLTMTLFMSIGVFFAILLKRVRTSAGLGFSIGLLSFVLNIICSLTEKDIFKFLSPFSFFDPKIVIVNGKIEITTILFALILMATLISMSFIKYIKADITRL